MKCELMTVSDFADEANGKITLVGVFAVIRGGALPVVAPSVSFAARLRIEDSDREREEHQFEICVLAPSATQVASIKAQISLKDRKNAERVQFVATSQRLRLPEEGAYRVVLKMNGAETHETGFRVTIREGLKQVSTH